MRGYRNTRTWGTGRQGKLASNNNERYRMGRQIFEGSLASSCTLCDNSMRSSGPVCGNDGKTYTSICEINTLSCKLIRRQGRSFKSRQLDLQVNHLGAFSAFGVRATNFGLCIHDFFQCVRVMRGKGM